MHERAQAKASNGERQDRAEENSFNYVRDCEETQMNK
jgi:hypothetical protein